MPRLLDTLDAAVGRTPEQLEDDTDYRRLQPPPDRLIDEEGHYNAGWYTHFDGELNLQDSSAFAMALHRWFHLTIDTGRYFIVCNLADLTRACNVAVMVCDKQSGRFEKVSNTRLLTQNHVQVSADGRVFEDPDSHSSICVDESEQRFAFSIHADHLHLSGVAHRALGPAMTQVTRYQRGRGSLQYYGNIQLEHGTLTMGRHVLPLPAGSYGTYDRTLGHQRGLQNWNWLAGNGVVRNARGFETPFGVQVAHDRPAARPQVRSMKYMVWLHGALHKLPSARFDYEVTDLSTHSTGPWRVVGEGFDQTQLDLRFTPEFHRRDDQNLGLLRADFNQYYGSFEGHFVAAGDRWTVQSGFAVTEDSLLEL